MKRIAMGLLLAVVAAAAIPDTTMAHGGFFSFWKQRPKHSPARERSFQRVGTLGNYLQYGEDGADETISEIVSATDDGRTLVYTDGVRHTIGFIDITRPGNPQPLGAMSLDPNPDDDTEYSPTSVDILGNQYALVAVSTGGSSARTGVLVVVNIATRAIVNEIDLGGQPDSIKISPDRKYAAIAIENERNEEVEVDGVEGGLPQAPAGFLAVLRLTGNSASWGPPATVDLTGLSTYAPNDPEPEFVDINDRNEAAITMQENNHIVIVDLATLTVKQHFSAGAVSLNGIDATQDDVISLSDSLADIPREPDAIAWVPGPLGTANLATANEGDLFGGSRGFSIFRRNGSVLFDSGSSLEELAVQHGHFPEDRADNKGTEPEAIAYARFGNEDYLFVGSERGSFVAVYTFDRLGRPQFDQLLPGPLGPEGLLVIPQRNLLVLSGETDLEGVGVRSTVMIYELKRGKPAYPQILSDDSDGAPIAWSALSGMVAVPWTHDTLLGVWDSAYAESNIFRIDVSERPALITDSLTIKKAGATRNNYDPEGIAIAPDQTLWLASEGNADDAVRQNLLVQVDFNGRVIREVPLPPQILACRQAAFNHADRAVFRTTLGSGFEGVAVVRSSSFTNNYRLIVAQQRGWNYPATAGAVNCDTLDDDDGGLNALDQPNWTRLWIYEPRTNTWDHVSWELAPKPENAAWVGLSEITEAPGGDYIVIERDNLTGDFAELKTLVKIHRNAFANDLVSTGEKERYDLLPKLLSTNGWITDKPEGTAVNWRGDLFVVTDNDGVSDWSGETWFFDLGGYWRLFR